MKLFNSTLINKITQFIIVFFSIILFSFSCIDGKCIESTACCWYDSCGKCNGDNLNINNYGRCDCEIDGDVYADCSGECGGNKSLDCNYECNGDAVIQTYWIDNDGDGLGYRTNMEYCSALVPNNWVLNDDDVDDNCPSCSDCLGIPNGDAQLDMCGAGDSASSNDCVQDCVGVWGWTDRPGTLAHWPGGLVVSFPNKSSVNGKIVFQPGDINLTFKKYFESEVIFNIENDFVTSVSGTGSDVKLMKNYLKDFGDKNAYATSHVGWGLNKKARYDALTMYDKSDLNGTELRALSGCFLYSIGANEFANRFTDGHFDLPMMECTILLDNKIVVDKGLVV